MIPVIYQNSNFVVINKPCGINMHKTAVDEQTLPSIVNILCEQENLDKLYLVHRLDTPTSGTMVLAKNKETAQNLNAQFNNREVTKYYLCILSKKPKKKQGKIQGFMAKSRNGNYKLVQEPKHATVKTTGGKNSEQSAVTLFVTNTLVKSHANQFHFGKEVPSNFQPSRYAIAKPLTGKTHQIRVAFKALGAPILGDERYKGADADRLYLHSMHLSFSLNNEKYEFNTLPQSGQYFNNEFLGSLPKPDSIKWPTYTIPKPHMPHSV